MKNLIYAAVFTLIFASSIPVGYAIESKPNFKISQIDHSNLHTSNPSYATHHFEVDVQGSALLELSIDLPENLSIGGIEVENQLGEKILATVAIADRKATIVFSQPVLPDTRLSIKMQGVNSRFYRSITQYRVYGKIVGLNTAITLGTVRIQTLSR